MRYNALTAIVVVALICLLATPTAANGNRAYRQPMLKPMAPPKISFGSTSLPALLPSVMSEGYVYAVNDLQLYAMNISFGASQANFFEPDISFVMLKQPTSIFVEAKSNIVVVIGEEEARCFRLSDGTVGPWRVIQPNFQMSLAIATNPGQSNPMPSFVDPMWLLGSKNLLASGDPSLGSYFFAIDPTDGDTYVNVNVAYPFTHYPTALLTVENLVVGLGRISETDLEAESRLLAVHYYQSRVVVDIPFAEPTPVPMFDRFGVPGVYLTLGIDYAFIAQYHRLCVYTLTVTPTPVLFFNDYNLTLLHDIPLGHGCFLPVAKPIPYTNASGTWLFVFCNATVFVYDVTANFSQVVVLEVPTNPGMAQSSGSSATAAAAVPRIMHAELLLDVSPCGGALVVATNQGHLALLDFCNGAIEVFHNESSAAPLAFDAGLFLFEGVSVSPAASALFAAPWQPSAQSGGLMVTFTARFGGPRGIVRGFSITNASGSVAYAGTSVLRPTLVWTITDGVKPSGKAAYDPATGYLSVATDNIDDYNLGKKDLFRVYDTSQIAPAALPASAAPLPPAAYPPTTQLFGGPFFASLLCGGLLHDSSGEPVQLLPLPFTAGKLGVLIIGDNRSASATAAPPSTEPFLLAVRTVAVDNVSWFVYDGSSLPLPGSVAVRSIPHQHSSVAPTTAVTALMALVDLQDEDDAVTCAFFDGSSTAQCLNTSSKAGTANGTTASIPVCWDGAEAIHAPMWQFNGTVTSSIQSIWAVCTTPLPPTPAATVFATLISGVGTGHSISGTHIAVDSASTGYPNFVSIVTPAYDDATDVFFALGRDWDATATELAVLTKFAANGTRLWQTRIPYSPLLPAPAASDAAAAIRFISPVVLEPLSGIASFVISLNVSRRGLIVAQTHLYALSAAGEVFNATVVWPLEGSVYAEQLSAAGMPTEFSSAASSKFVAVNGDGRTKTNPAQRDFSAVVVGASHTFVVAVSAATGEVLWARPIGNRSDDSGGGRVLPVSLAADVVHGIAAVLTTSGLFTLSVFTGYTLWVGFLTAVSQPGTGSSAQIHIVRGRVVYCAGTQVTGAAVASGRIAFAVSLAIGDEGLQTLSLATGLVTRYSVQDTLHGGAIFGLQSAYAVSTSLVAGQFFAASPLVGADAILRDNVVLGRFANLFAETRSATYSTHPTLTDTRNVSNTPSPTESLTDSPTATDSSSDTPTPSKSENATATQSLGLTATANISTVSHSVAATPSHVPTHTPSISSTLNTSRSHAPTRTHSLNASSATATETQSDDGTATITVDGTGSWSATKLPPRTPTVTATLTGDIASATITYKRTDTREVPETDIPPTVAPTPPPPLLTDTPTSAVPRPPTPRPANITIGNATAQASPASKAWIAGPTLGGLGLLAGIAWYMQDGGGGDDAKKDGDQQKQKQPQTPSQQQRPPRQRPAQGELDAPLLVPPEKLPASPPPVMQREPTARPMSNTSSNAKTFSDPFHDPFLDPFEAKGGDGEEMLQLQPAKPAAAAVSVNPLLNLAADKAKPAAAAAKPAVAAATGNRLVLEEEDSSAEADTSSTESD